MFLCFMNSLCKNGMQLRRIPGNAADEPGGRGMLDRLGPERAALFKNPRFSHPLFAKARAEKTDI